jgi:hypothetical protein
VRSVSNTRCLAIRRSSKAIRSASLVRSMRLLA